MTRTRHKIQDRGCKIQILGLCCFVLIFLLFGGCSSESKSYKVSQPKANGVGKTSTEEKKAELLKQIDRKFEDPEAHFQLGQLYQTEGMWSKAEDCYNTALNFKPAYRQAQAAMVKTLIDSGDKTKAAQLADIYMGQASIDATESVNLALAFQGQQLDEYALACYQQGLRLAPNSAKINRQMGYYYLSKGDKERARDYLIRSFSLNPNQPEVAGELGRLGVETRIPRKTEQSTKNLDKIVEKSDEKYR